MLHNSSDNTAAAASAAGAQVFLEKRQGTKTERSHLGQAERILESKAPTGFACELSIVMPCLNEAETLGVCIKKAKMFLARSNVVGEIIVADNGSTDGSQQIASRLEARVVQGLWRRFERRDC